MASTLKFTTNATENISFFKHKPTVIQLNINQIENGTVLGSFSTLKFTSKGNRKQSLK